MLHKIDTGCNRPGPAFIPDGCRGSFPMDRVSVPVPRVKAVSPAKTASVTDEKPTLMLLDGNSLAFRAFYALPAENFKTQGGLTTNAVYGFTAMLINLLRDEQPSHIAAAFDVSRQTFRKEKYPEYKEGRSATPDEFRGQIDITKEVLGALGITVLAEPGFEADDIIATLATQAENEATGCWWSPGTGTPCSWSAMTSPCSIRARGSAN